MKIVLRGDTEKVKQAAALLRSKLPEATEQPIVHEEGHKDSVSVTISIIALLLALPGSINNTLSLVDRRKKAIEEREAVEKAAREAQEAFLDIEVTFLDEPEEH